MIKYKNNYATLPLTAVKVHYQLYEQKYTINYTNRQIIEKAALLFGAVVLVYTSGRISPLLKFKWYTKYQNKSIYDIYIPVVLYIWDVSAGYRLQPGL